MNRAARRAQQRALARVGAPSRLPVPSPAAVGRRRPSWVAEIEFSGQAFGKRPLPVLPVDLAIDGGDAAQVVMLLDSGASTSAIPDTYFAAAGLTRDGRTIGWDDLDDGGVTHTFAGPSERRRLPGRLSFAGIVVAEPIVV